jgi:hypothetical protein
MYHLSLSISCTNFPYCVSSLEGLYILVVLSEIHRMRKPSCDIKLEKNINKGVWSKREDQKLIDYINKHGEVCWSTLPQAAGILYEFTCNNT